MPTTHYLIGLQLRLLPLRDIGIFVINSHAWFIFWLRYRAGCAILWDYVFSRLIVISLLIYQLIDGYISLNYFSSLVVILSNRLFGKLQIFHFIIISFNIGPYLNLLHCFCYFCLVAFLNSGLAFLLCCAQHMLLYSMLHVLSCYTFYRCR